MAETDPNLIQPKIKVDLKLIPIDERIGPDPNLIQPKIKKLDPK